MYLPYQKVEEVVVERLDRQNLASAEVGGVEEAQAFCLLRTTRDRQISIRTIESCFVRLVMF